MVDFGNALGSLVGGLFGLGSAGAQYAMQKDLMAYQAQLNYKYGKKATLNQYGWQRQGLEKAGYNPLLALGGAEGVANTGWTSAQSAPEVNPLNSALAIQQNQREKDLNEANIKNIFMDTKLKEMQAQDLSETIYRKDIYNQKAEMFRDLELGIHSADLLFKQTTNKFLPDKLRAEIQELATRSLANSADAYFNTHRALGYSESYSQSDSRSAGEELGLNLYGGKTSKQGSRTKTRSYSKSW